MSKGWIHESTYNESKEWYTPKYIFDALDIQFDLDPCSPECDVVPWIPAKRYYTVEDNGLEQIWSGNVWMNPPYGSDTPKWMKKLEEHGNGIALVFARTDTKWFHDYVPNAHAVCFIKGRISFVPADRAEDYTYNLWEPKGGSGAASILVAYGENNVMPLVKSGLGLVLL